MSCLETYVSAIPEYITKVADRNAAVVFRTDQRHKEKMPFRATEARCRRCPHASSPNLSPFSRADTYCDNRNTAFQRLGEIVQPHILRRFLLRQNVSVIGMESVFSQIPAVKLGTDKKMPVIGDAGGQDQNRKITANSALKEIRIPCRNDKGIHVGYKLMKS